MGRLEDEIEDLFKDERLDFEDLQGMSVIDMRDVEIMKYFDRHGFLAPWKIKTLDSEEEE